MDATQLYMPADAWMQYAGFWRRLAAGAIDAVMLLFSSFAAALVIVPFLLAAPDRTTGLLSGPRSPYFYGGVAFLIAWLYFAGFESSAGQGTIGKTTLGMAVTTAQGDPISFWRASLRFLAKLLSALPLGAGFLLIPFDKRKRGLHDRIAGTVVILRDPFRGPGER